MRHVGYVATEPFITCVNWLIGLVMTANVLLHLYTNRWILSIPAQFPLPQLGAVLSFGGHGSQDMKLVYEVYIRKVGCQP